MRIEICFATTMLLDDDDSDDRILTPGALPGEWLTDTMHEVADGADLLDKLHRRGRYVGPGSASGPRLILLDMPPLGRDWFQIVEQLRSRERTV
jgi:CheY-like chemotaxis protein